MEREYFFSPELLQKLDSYESFDEFLVRIFSFQKREFRFGVERFYSSDSVKSKVEDGGSFSRFIGDTVVFNLDDYQKKFIYEHFINPLYDAAPECFAEKLMENTIHMTLHDLNATNRPDYGMMERIFDAEISMSKIIGEANVKKTEIHMVTNCVFNMVNTSMVLGLRPKNPEDYDKLMQLYCMVDNVQRLPYPLTPHITLAYYCREGFLGQQIERIQDVVNGMNTQEFEIVLSTDMLFYQKFTSMNEYYNIMCFVRK